MLNTPNRRLMTGLLLVALAGSAVAHPPAGRPESNHRPHDNAQPARVVEGWRLAESPVLSEHTRLTSPEMFDAAGEAYFNHDKTWIIFQARLVPDAQGNSNPNYEMFVAKLQKVDDQIVGIETPIQVSKPGSANTCGWFHPTEPRILFGSTVVPPEDEKRPGYQREGSNYEWAFPTEMDIVTAELRWMETGETPETVEGPGGVRILKSAVTTPLFTRAGYDAEGSWSPCGRYVLYTNVDPQTDDADLYIWDSELDEHTLVVSAPGYDGGPFFGPEGKRILYRSDRRGDKHLQVFISDLAFDEKGRPSQAREYAITDDDHVNWAPFFHPTGRFLVMTTSRMGHFNYEVFGIDARSGLAVADRAAVQVTIAEGFDGLAVFSDDGRTLMWTGQRTLEGDESGPSSHLWLADFDLRAYEEAQVKAEQEMFGGGGS